MLYPSEVLIWLPRGHMAQSRGCSCVASCNIFEISRKVSFWFSSRVRSSEQLVSNMQLNLYMSSKLDISLVWWCSSLAHAHLEQRVASLLNIDPFELLLPENLCYLRLVAHHIPSMEVKDLSPAFKHRSYVVSGMDIDHINWCFCHVPFSCPFQLKSFPCCLWLFKSHST